MPLPFPHGSGPGQIANGHNYDDHDTPGFPGGRFIGFAEFATSAITNRAAWALSSNIDYIYQKYASAIAVPQVDKYTSSGSSSHLMNALVFCGDVTYPPTAAEGLMLLFSVLDDQYNALTDGAGNEVRVSSVVDVISGGSAYGTGFVQSPIVHFCTVNPETGVVVLNPYPIPAAQVVRIAYGIASSLEYLPVDAFTRYKVMSGEEIPAGVLLLDGSLPMAGNLNMGGNSISSVSSIGLTDLTSDLFTMSVGAGVTTLTTHMSGVGDATLVSDPNNGIGLRSVESFDLGSSTDPWGTVWAYDLVLSGPHRPLLSDDDYYFKEDFACLESNSCIGTSIKVGTWLYLSGTTSAGLTPPGSPSTYGRSTVNELFPTTAPSAYATINGPALLDLQGDLIHALVGFALDTLPDPSGDDYTLSFGFNVTLPAASLQAFILVKDEGAGAGTHMYLVYGDGDYGHSDDLGPVSAQTWYDVHMAFGAGNISVYVNGVLAEPAVSCVLPAQDSPGYVFTALRLDLTGGFDCGYVGPTAEIDYATLYSQGHQPRPYTSL